MLEDIEALINEHCQKHPQVSNDQEEASNILELEELSTLEEENIIEEPDDDDSVIGDQLADVCDQLIPVQTNAKARELNPSSALASAVVMTLQSVP